MREGFFDYLTGGSGKKTTAKEDFKVIRPADFEQIQNLISGLKRGEGFIADFEGADRQLAQRMLDLLSGACFALDARMEGIKNKMYLLLPSVITVRTRKQKE